METVFISRLQAARLVRLSEARGLVTLAPIGLVALIKDSFASSPVATQSLRNNVSVPEGPGDTIAVLTG
jgi:hypothetical protein